MLLCQLTQCGTNNEYFGYNEPVLAEDWADNEDWPDSRSPYKGISQFCVLTSVARLITQGGYLVHVITGSACVLIDLIPVFEMAAE